MLDEIGVVFVRHLEATRTSLGVGRDDDSYYVYDREDGKSAFDWHMHCGPYSTFEQAVDWIRAIRESASSRGGA